MTSASAPRFDRPFAVFEDNLGDPAQLNLLQNLLCCISAHTPAELPGALAAIEAARNSGHWIAFAGNYELGAALEAALHDTLPEDSHAELLLKAWVFAQCSRISGDAIATFWQSALARLSPQEKEAGILSLQPDWDEARHATAVERILAWIYAGDCYQTNLTFPLYGQAFGHPIALFARLRETQPVAHGALIFDGQDWILSRSPELFVAHRGAELICRPMKGTAQRSQDPGIDAANAAALQASTKDRAENLMIVDLIRNDLGRLAPPGGVRVEQLFELEVFQTVFQLTSTVRAAPVDAKFETVLRALFPCGSITGAPKIRAMQIIHALEDGPRGLYCGALGWLAPDGDFSLNVPIRTLLLRADGYFRLDVGSGIVADSQAAAEYRECLAKADFVRKLGTDLELIETLKWTPQTSYPDLDWHLARLARSAQELGFVFDHASQSRMLLEFAATLPAHAQRVRLSMARDGKTSLLAAALEAPAMDQKTAWAPFALNSNDPRLRHKSTARVFYETALKAAMEAGLFDVIFCNERGELCEGARSNLFLELDDGPLRTPELLCGLLPGVLRAQLLAEGRAVEAVLSKEDLLKARRIWLGNALRGLVEVKLLPAAED
ncbi:aminodeoxychorismate synthase component I [Uliginosibacterium flavum]|uniref:Aminodeoxychorismate synthase component I n=1 Tax=Uliginosibacterium flavum TaxID=1396831 RepID=A0ABV2TIN6_9RHOO